MHTSLHTSVPVRSHWGGQNGYLVPLYPSTRSRVCLLSCSRPFLLCLTLLAGVDSTSCWGRSGRGEERGRARGERETERERHRKKKKGHVIYCDESKIEGTKNQIDLLLFSQGGGGGDKKIIQVHALSHEL